MKLLSTILKLGLRGGARFYFFYRRLKESRHYSTEIFASRYSIARHPIRMRHSLADAKAFKDVFLRQDYNVALDADPESIVDLGANIGLSAVYFANKYPRSVVYAVEPDAANQQILLSNTSRYSNVVSIQAAVWNRKASLCIVNPAEVNQDSFRVGECGGAASSVAGVTLFEIMETYKLSRIDLLKVDIEGSECQIFQEGYNDWLPFVRSVVIELHDRIVPGCQQAVFGAAKKHNFAVTSLGHNIYHLRNGSPQTFVPGGASSALQNS